MAGCFHQLKIDYCVPVDEKKKRDKSLRDVEPLQKIRKAIRNVISMHVTAVTTNTRENEFCNLQI